MKRGDQVKFPNSIQLFKFCQKIMSLHQGKKVNDQEIGNVLEFNPSDCSHWKKGEKNIKSLFDLNKLADTLKVENGIIHDLASGVVGLDEAMFEVGFTTHVSQITTAIQEQLNAADMQVIRQRTLNFVSDLHRQLSFSTPPIYLPEAVGLFGFIQVAASEMTDKLSRIIKQKHGLYVIYYKKGDLRPQTRLSIVKDMSRIVFEAERSRFPQLGALDEKVISWEEHIFANEFLAPKNLVRAELEKLDPKRNMIQELAALFWAPRSVIAVQLKDMIFTPTAESEQLERTMGTDFSQNFKTGSAS